jgi:hypothetical protein
MEILQSLFEHDVAFFFLGEAQEIKIRGTISLAVVFLELLLFTLNLYIKVYLHY